MATVKISKSSGLTPTENVLASLCEKSFLSLWSYPNVHYAPGKELCDILVLFGNDVLIFSDKACEYKATADEKVGWRRWYKRAIYNSAGQVFRAERRIRDHPGDLFLDGAAKSRFPLTMPSPEKMRIHRILVADGASEASKEYFSRHGSALNGGLLIRSDVRGDAHEDNLFTVGWIANDDRFVHVFDARTLEIALEEFDTIKDFVFYLTAKEDLFKKVEVVAATGEEELISWYVLATANSLGPRAFPINSGISSVGLEEGNWQALRSHPVYLAKKEADKDSYLWDYLIEFFNKTYMNGALEAGGELSADEYGRAVAVMASESRYSRRLLAKAFLSSAPRENSNDEDGDPKFRVGATTSIDRPGLAYVFAFQRPTAEEERSDEAYRSYREVRVVRLFRHCEKLRHAWPQIDSVIGLFAEFRRNVLVGADLIYHDPSTWSEKQAELMETLRSQGGALQLRTVEKFGELDFPLSANGDPFALTNDVLAPAVHISERLIELIEEPLVPEEVSVNGICAAEAALVARLHAARSESAPPDPDLISDALSLSGRLGEIGRKDAATDVIRSAVELCRPAATADPIQYVPILAAALVNLSNWTSKTGDKTAGLAAAEEAVELSRRAAAARPQVNDLLLAGACSALSDRLYEAGRGAEALAPIREAETLFRGLVARRPDQHNPGLSAVLNTMYQRLDHEGLQQEALAAIREAVILRRELVARKPGRYESDLASSLNNLAGALSACDPQGAMAAIEESVDLFRSAAATNSRRNSANLGHSLNTLSTRLCEANDLRGAAAASLEAAELFRGLAESDPETYGDDFVLSRNKLAANLANLSSQPRDRVDKTEALQAVTKAVGIFRELVERDPARYRTDLAASLVNLGARRAEGGDTDGAVAAACEAIALYDGLGPEQASHRRHELASGLFNLALIHYRGGDLPGGLVAIRRAIELRRQLATEDGARHGDELVGALHLESLLENRMAQRPGPKRLRRLWSAARRWIRRAGPDAHA
jgi:hypothetical protein